MSSSSANASFSCGQPANPSVCAKRTSVPCGTSARTATLRIDTVTISFGWSSATVCYKKCKVTQRCLLTGYTMH